jgi:hypothetical protein
LTPFATFLAFKQQNPLILLRADGAAALLRWLRPITQLEHDMADPNHKTDPGARGRPFMEECDIGSGEKTPAQLETEEMIRQIPPLPPKSQQPENESGTPQGGQAA